MYYRVNMKTVGKCRSYTLTHILGGFGGHKDHDPHLLYTLSAIQILLIQDAKDRIDVDKVVECE